MSIRIKKHLINLKDSNYKKKQEKVFYFFNRLLSKGINILFPKFCFGCQKEGDYLCQDCKQLLEISGFHQDYSTQYLDDLYFPVDYKKPLIKKLIQSFKYQPFAKELGKTFSCLIIDHFQLIDNKMVSVFNKKFKNFILVPVPLDKKRLKWRGFNQAEVLSKELTKSLKLPLISNCLIKTKETAPQSELSGQEKKENIKGAFSINPQIKNYLKNKNALLIDDVYESGATMEECAQVLKKAGVKKIVGIVIARK